MSLKHYFRSGQYFALPQHIRFSFSGSNADSPNLRRLIGRTESRERLPGMAEGRKSRKASPARSMGLGLRPLAED